MDLLIAAVYYLVQFFIMYLLRAAFVIMPPFVFVFVLLAQAVGSAS